MKAINFIELHQTEFIEKILRDCGLWEPPARVEGGARVTSYTDNTPAEGPNFYWIKVNVPPELRRPDCL